MGQNFVPINTSAPDSGHPTNSRYPVGKAVIFFKTNISEHKAYMENILKAKRL